MKMVVFRCILLAVVVDIAVSTAVFVTAPNSLCALLRYFCTHRRSRRSSGWVWFENDRVFNWLRARSNNEIHQVPVRTSTECIFEQQFQPHLFIGHILYTLHIESATRKADHIHRRAFLELWAQKHFEIGNQCRRA